MTANNRLLALVFALLALPTCLIMCIVVPPMQAPDEIAHYGYARSISLGQLTAKSNGSIAAGVIRQSDVPLIYPFHSLTFDTNSKVSRGLFEAAGAPKPAEDPLVPFDITGAASYFPSSYFAPALGIKLADLAGRSALEQLYAGRAVNLLLYVALASITILVAPYAPSTLLVIFLLPMNLQQAASMSPDAFTFPAAGLAVALFLLGAKDKNERLRWPQLASATALATLCAMTRLPLVLLAVLPAYLAASKRRLEYLWSAILIVCALGVWLYFFSFPAENANRVAELGHVSASEQLRMLLTRPSHLISVASNTLQKFGLMYAVGALGVFGTLDIYMSEMAYLALAALLVGSLLIAADEHRLELGLRTTLIGIAAASAGASIAAIYLTWTPVGNQTVIGFQGRYLIPSMIMLAFGMSGLFNRATGSIAHKNFVAAVAGLHSIVSGHAIALILGRFYLS